MATGEPPYATKSKFLLTSRKVLLGNRSPCQLCRNNISDVRITKPAPILRDEANFHIRRNVIGQQFMRKLQRRGINQSRKKRQAQQEYGTKEKQR